MKELLQGSMAQSLKERALSLISRHTTRKKLRFNLMTFFVYLPTLFLFLYLTFIHSPMYISEVAFALRSADSTEASGSPGGLLGQAVTAIVMDAYIIQNHIESMDMMHKVDAVIDLKSHYADSKRDIYSRLKSDPTQEEMFEYWQSIVSALFTLEEGIITVEVKAYTPEMSKKINDTILQYSEALVNEMNNRAHQDALRLTREEINLAEKRVLSAQEALRHFRDASSILDPKVTAEGLESVVAGLETEAALAQAELTAALQVMQPDSPKVKTLQMKLLGLQDQLVREKTRLAGIDDGTVSLSSLVGDYAQLVREEEFAGEQLKSSMTAFDNARLRAIAQSRYIVPFLAPTLPQESLYPRPLLFTFLGFLILLIAVGICSLTIAAIKDHMGV